MKRVSLYYLALIVALLVCVVRLISLQIVDGQYYRVLADENRVKLEIIRAQRGVMYDRHGEILVRNGPEGREYVYGKDLRQVLGYVGEVDESEIELLGLEMKDVVGKMGIEKEYDKVLRGEDGGVLVETESNGERLREIGRKEPITGESLKLTIDIGLQKKAVELMGDEKGALVASNPETGEILALVSSPGFDPKEIEKALSNQDLPMFNRAIGGEYAPGSTFKIVTATAGLEENKIDETTEIEDTGEIKIGDIWRYGNWYYDQYGQKEGFLEITRAIARSNDIFFYKLGELLGIEMLADWAKYFGLNHVTEIDLPGESNGLMPDPKWKKDFWDESWFLGDTYISAIGQGNILMTPLQVNQMLSVIASRGKWCQPHLNQGLEIKCQQLDISVKTLDLVTEGLRQVCETGGTAWPMFDFNVTPRRQGSAGQEAKKIPVAGKTGTAEFGAKDDKETHAWFSAFAPVDEPQIVVTVLKEAAGQGSDEAAPIVRDLFEYWFNRQ